MFLLLIPLLLTCLICYLNGSNDGKYLLLPLFCNENVFNKFIKNKYVLLLPLIGEIIGGIFLGEIILKKIQFGYIDIFSLSHTNIYLSAIGILSITLLIYFISSFLPFPISLSHTIIGGLVGIALAFKVKVNWNNLAITWIIWTITPLISMIIGFIIFKFNIIFSFKRKNPIKTIQLFSFFTILVSYILLLFIAFKLSGIGFIVLTIVFTLFILILARKFFLSKIFTKKTYKETYKETITEQQSISSIKEYKKTEDIFSFLSLLILPNVFISHGANDVANSCAILVLLSNSIFKETLPENSSFFLILLSSLILAFSLVIKGKKNAQRLSCNIFNIDSDKIFTTYYSLSMSTITFSLLGYRISSIYTLSGSYIGVGYARGFSIFNSKLLFEFLLSWIVTSAISILLSFLFSTIIGKLGIFIW